MTPLISIRALMLGVALVALPVSAMAAYHNPPAHRQCSRNAEGSFVDKQGNALEGDEAASCLNWMAPAAGDDGGGGDDNAGQDGAYDAPDATPPSDPTPPDTTPPDTTPPEDPTPPDEYTPPEDSYQGETAPR